MTKRRVTPACSSDLRERGVRLFRENRADCASVTAAYRAIAPKLGCWPDVLRAWCRQAECDDGQRAGLTRAEKVRTKALEREKRALRTAYEIPKKGETEFRHWSEDNGEPDPGVGRGCSEGDLPREWGMLGPVILRSC